jgi:hypothetical protein
MTNNTEQNAAITSAKLKALREKLRNLPPSPYVPLTPEQIARQQYAQSKGPTWL